MLIWQIKLLSNSKKPNTVMLVNYLFTIEAGVFRKLIQKLKAAKQ
jgi:hypothetical protein